MEEDIIIRGELAAKVANISPSGLMPAIVMLLKNLSSDELREVQKLSDEEILKRISIEPHEAR